MTNVNAGVLGSQLSPAAAAAGQGGQPRQAPALQIWTALKPISSSRPSSLLRL